MISFHTIQLPKSHKSVIWQQISFHSSITLFKINIYPYFQIHLNHFSVKYFLIRLFLVYAFLVISAKCMVAQDTRILVYEGILHYTISAEISFASCMFFTLKTPDMSLATKYLISSGITLAGGFAKELADELVGYFDWIDIGFDVLGIGSGLVLHYFVFDRKMKRSSISFNVTSNYYLVSVKFYF